jgi:hypothetical protein
LDFDEIEEMIISIVSTFQRETLYSGTRVKCASAKFLLWTWWLGLGWSIDATSALRKFNNTRLPWLLFHILRSFNFKKHLCERKQNDWFTRGLLKLRVEPLLNLTPSFNGRASLYPFCTISFTMMSLSEALSLFARKLQFILQHTEPSILLLFLVTGIVVLAASVGSRHLATSRS